MGAGYSELNSIAVDPEGNVVSGGQFEGAIAIADTVLLAGGMEALLVKYGPGGEFLWARTAGSADPTSLDRIVQVALDPDGNIYAVGDHSGSTPVLFDGVQVADSGGGSFLCKYGPDGSVLFAVEVSLGDPAFSLAVDPEGNVDVIGGDPFFWRRFDENGAEIQGWSLQGSLYSYPRPQVTHGPGGELHVIATALTDVDVDPDGDVNTIAAGTGCLLKYDATGAFEWAATSPDMLLFDVVVNDAGEVFVCVDAGDSPTQFAGLDLGPGNLMLKLSADGEGVLGTFILEVPDGGYQDLRALALDLGDNLFVAGQVRVNNMIQPTQTIAGQIVPFELSDFVAAMDGSGAETLVDFVVGSLVWRPYVRDLSAGPGGVLAVCGTFHDQVGLGSTELLCAGSQFYIGVHDHSSLGSIDPKPAADGPLLRCEGGTVWLQGAGLSDITVRDAQGRIVCAAFDTRTWIDVSGFASGLYTLVGTSNGRAVTVRFPLMR